MGLRDGVVPPQQGVSRGWDRLDGEEKLQERLWDAAAPSGRGLHPFQPRWDLSLFYFWLC